MGCSNLRFAFVVVLLSSWSSVAWGQAAPGQQPAPAQPPAAQPPPAPPPVQSYPPPPQAQPYPPQAQPYPPQAQPYPPQAQPYPPQAQPYPYPPPSYPTPPQGYPPPQPYPQAPSYAPPQPSPSRYPEDASTQASPFFDAILMGVAADERFSDALVIGGQVGGYIGGWLRLSARLGVPTDPTDNSTILINYAQQIDTPSILYGGSLGVVVARRTKFLFAPGITVNRTDIGDYGTLFGASMPFEWVMRGGTRFGFEVDFGRGIGGEQKYLCSAPNCTAEVIVDRDPGVFFMIGLNIGFGLGYPEPTSPSAK